MESLINHCRTVDTGLISVFFNSSLLGGIGTFLMNYLELHECFCRRVWVCVCLSFFRGQINCFPVYLCVGGVTVFAVSLQLHESCRGGLIKSSLSPPDIGVSVKSPQIFHLHFSFPKRRRQEEEAFGVIPVQRGDSKDWWFILVQHS